MAKPIEMFRGRAPQAMAQMGEGVAQGYANAGAITGASYAKLGEQIGGALQTAASVYANNKEIKGKTNANLKALEANPELFGMQAGDAAKHKANMSDMSTTEKYDYLSTVMSNSMMGKQQQFKMDQIGYQNQGELQKAVLSGGLNQKPSPSISPYDLVQGESSHSIRYSGSPLAPAPASESVPPLPLPSGGSGQFDVRDNPLFKSAYDQALQQLNKKYNRQ